MSEGGILRWTIAIVSAMCLTSGGSAFAGDVTAIPKVGALVRPQVDAPYEAGLRDGLRELGYIEGKNISIEWQRSAGGDQDALLAADLVRSNLDIVVVFSTSAARAAIAASKMVPIVFLSGDPVATGLATSLAAPGGNATGVTGVMTELTSKRMELLHQAVPSVKRIICLVNPANAASMLQLDAAREAGHTLGLKVSKLEVRDGSQLDAVLRKLPRGPRSALFVTADGVFLVNKAKIAQAVRDAHLPATFPYRDYHEEGALMSYGLNPHEAGRKMARYVDKIIKGAKPADLPIEQVSKYEFIIDLGVAHELGIKIPNDALVRADEVIR